MNKDFRFGLIGSCLPKKCGIATFGRDLIDAIKANLPDAEEVIAAAETENETYQYDESVVAILKTSSRQSYIRAAEILNNSNLD